MTSRLNGSPARGKNRVEGGVECDAEVVREEELGRHGEQVDVAPEPVDVGQVEAYRESRRRPAPRCRDGAPPAPGSG